MAADEDAWYAEEEREERRQGRISDLSQREREVLELVVAGKSNGEISWLLRITPHTAKAHVASIIRKLGVASRTEAAVMWVRNEYQRAEDHVNE